MNSNKTIKFLNFSRSTTLMFVSFFIRGHLKHSKNSNSKFIRDALPSVYLWHSAKPLFAECQIKYTRQKNLAKKNLKIPNGPKKSPKFHVKQSMLSIIYKKVLNSNNNSIVNLTPNLIGSFSTLWFFFEDVSICKHVHDKVCKTSSNFSHNLHIWYYDILPNLIIFRPCLLFFKFLKNSKMGCLPSAHPLKLGKHLFAEC